MVRQKLVEERDVPRFKRVSLSLGQVLQGDFFKEYVKIGKPCSSERATRDTAESSLQATS